MEYQLYYQTAQQAAQLVERGDYTGALEALRTLLASDISDLDKSMMCLNMAVVYDKMGRKEESLSWYDRGIAYERKHKRFQVAEHKAAYLSQSGQSSESLVIFEDLINQPSMTESDKERIRHNINQVKESLS